MAVLKECREVVYSLNDVQKTVFTSIHARLGQIQDAVSSIHKKAFVVSVRTTVVRKSTFINHELKITQPWESTKRISQ